MHLLQKKIPQLAIEALEIFLYPYMSDSNVLGIFLTGSYVHSTPGPNSDLDIWIILNTSETRERGNTWINGFELEYFINPVPQAYHYFKTEEHKHTANMFTNNIILFERNNSLRPLINKANMTLAEEQPELSYDEIELAKYLFDDLLKDFKDNFVKKDYFSFHLTGNKIIDEGIKCFFKIHRLLPNKTKRLQQMIKRVDSSFEEQLEKVIEARTNEEYYINILDLVIQIEIMLGGSRTKEWKLSGRCPYLDDEEFVIEFSEQK